MDELSTWLHLIDCCLIVQKISIGHISQDLAGKTRYNWEKSSN
jgi:hypothetical protein